MDLRIWQSLAEPKHEELVRVAAATNPKDVAAVERLRKITTSGELIHAALQLAEARRKGMGKFGKRGATLWADPQGVEMATSLVVAEHKAARFGAGLAGRSGLDLCCGIGGDAMALAPVLGLAAVDLDPVRAWMAGRNAACASVVADVTTIGIPDGPIHIDPSRRTEDGRKRLWNSADLLPPLEAIGTIFESARWGGAIKLGPGADLAEVERRFPGVSIEIISDNGVLAQAVVWIGGHLRSNPRTREATLITRRPDEASTKGSTQTLSGAPSGGEFPIVADSRPARYIFEPDDSVERAELLATLCRDVDAPMLHPRLGLLTSDAMIQSPWLTPFEVCEVLPWHERTVRAALEARGAGIVEVKTRGRAVDPDEVQTQLRGHGDHPLTVFILRFDRAVRAIIARRVGQGGPRSSVDCSNLPD